ncbi:MAG: MFS transporter [Anaerolineae bacterium]
MKGMRGFTLVWFGQIVSLIGTAMSQFAITVWAYQETGQATTLALVGTFSFLPTVVLSPFAGAIVDRSNRKLVMMLSDFGAAIATGTLLLLASLDVLQIWHLYIAGAFAGVFQAFQFPAYSAAITMMIPKEQYARASGMMSVAQTGSIIIAPVLGGILLAAVGLTGVFIADLATFSAAFVTLFLAHIPQPEETSEGREGSGKLWQEAVYGFRYIFQRRSLLGLQIVFFFINLVASFAIIVLAAMILAETNNDELAFGSVQSAMGIGGLAGSILLSVWGGPKRRVHGVLGGMAATCLFGLVVLGLGRSLPVWLLGAFMFQFFIPLLNGSNQAIWQAKVAPDVQGRVFAARRTIAQITAPVAMVIAGPLADFVFEPALMPGGALVPLFSWLVGTGPGSGMSLMFVLAGLSGVGVAGVGYLVPAIREAEDLLPDHAVTAVPSDEAAQAAAPAVS